MWWWVWWQRVRRIPILGFINLNQWYHVAVVREGNVYRGYLNGVQTWTQTVAGSLYDSTPRGLILGANAEYTWGSAPKSPLDGYIDDLRISKGVALYTGNSFTPPSALM